MTKETQHIYMLIFNSCLFIVSATMTGMKDTLFESETVCVGLLIIVLIVLSRICTIVHCLKLK